jgi:hypothetical protein
MSIEALSFIAPLLAAAGVRTVAANRQARRTLTLLRLHSYFSTADARLNVSAFVLPG